MVKNIEITQLQLYNFRNYQNKIFDFQQKINIFLGRNGIGKSNILEAVTLLRKGSGLKKADFDDIICNNIKSNTSIPNNFSIFAKIKNHPNIDEIGTNYDGEKRIFQINASKNSNYKQEIPIIYLIPQMDNIFCDSKSNRRGFLDNLIANINSEHKTNINNYNKQIRERAKLLEKYHSDKNNIWLNIIEKKISEIGSIIAFNRNEIIDYLNRSILQSKSNFTKTQIKIIGEIEEFALNNTAIATENFFQEKLKANREKDFEKQRTNSGIHLSDFTAFLDNKMEAKNCSTGEQKSILIAIIFGFIRIFNILNLPCPILLLDEITSHLDQNKRKNLFLEIKNLKIQCFLTGTEKYLFSDFIEEVEFIEL